jgi:superfamily I DNA/RNA helicase
LSELHKLLVKKYPQIEFGDRPDEVKNKALDGIKILMKDPDANLGWRIMAGELLSPIALKTAVIESQKIVPFKDILDEEFVKSVTDIIELIKRTNNETRSFSKEEKQHIKNVIDDDSVAVIEYFSPKIEETKPQQDNSKPTILLRTFEGSKGLSGGHVFIVSANDGSIPKIVDGKINDIECCKFIVAITRTRKQCHIISNIWLNSPKNPKGEWEERFERSQFIDMIPKKYIEDQGYKKSAEII